MERKACLPEPCVVARAGDRPVNRASGVVLRYLLYMLLMIVRVPLQVAIRLVAFPLVGLGILWGCAAGWTSPACMWMSGTGAGLLVAGFLFDSLLLWVSPERLYLEG